MVLSSLPLGAGLALTYFALDAGRKFAPNDPARVFFVGIPFMIAVIMVAAVAITLYQFLNREVEIDGEHLTYRDFKTEMTLEISKMAFSPPPDSGLIKSMMLSDGEIFVHLPKVFMEEEKFNDLLDQIKKRRRRTRVSSGPTTYSL